MRYWGTCLRNFAKHVGGSLVRAQQINNNMIYLFQKSDGECRKAIGLELYEDQNSGFLAQARMDAATAMHPAQAGLAECQKVSIGVVFGEDRSYAQVDALVGDIFQMGVKRGWEVSSAPEGFPDVASSISDLKDLWQKEDWAYTEGFNAAGGFKVVLEKPGTKPSFSEEEVKELEAFRDEVFEMSFPGEGMGSWEFHKIS